MLGSACCSCLLRRAASQIVRNVSSWGMDFEAPALEGRLRIVSRYPERMGLQDLLVEIKREVDAVRSGARRDRQHDGAHAQRRSPRVS